MKGWNTLTSVQDLNDAISLSTDKPVILFKHSTRCSISTMAYNRVELATNELTNAAECYYLDLIQFRDVSGAIATELNVHHESPQVLIVKGKECTYDASHNDIRAKEILENI